MPQEAWLCGSFLTRFSPRVQPKLLPLAQTFRFKAGEDIISEGGHSLYLCIKGGALMDACREDYELGFELYRALTEVIASRFISTRLQLVNVFSTG